MKIRLTATRPAAAAAAILAAGVLLASCSSGTDGSAKSADETSASPSTSSSVAAPSSTATTSADAAPPAASQTGSDDEAITAVAIAYLTGINSGSLDAISAVSCKQLVDTIPEGSPDFPPLEQPITVDSVENIQIDGDMATADVTASLKDEPSEAPQTESLSFVNEGGWKYCQ